MENYFIEFFQTHHTTGKGYNMTKGGEGGPTSNNLTPEQHVTWKNSLLGRKPWNKGKKVGSPSEETRKKLSIASKLARQDKFWTTTKRD